MTTLPEYSFIVVPLDGEPGASPQSFAMTIVTNIDFHDSAGLTSAELRAIVGEHPLLRRQAQTKLRVFVWDYAAYVTNGYVIDPRRAQRGSLAWTGHDTPEQMSDVLSSYLAGGSEPRNATKIQPDTDFDKLKDEDFFDTGESLDDMRRVAVAFQTYAIHALKEDRENLELDPKTVSLDLGRWINATSQAAMLQMLFNNDNRFAPLIRSAGLGGEVSRLRQAIGKIRKRIPKTEYDPITKNKCKPFPQQPKPFEVRDLNVAVRAGVKNALLARKTGLVTEWRVQLNASLQAGVNYVIAIEVGSLTYDSKVIEVAPSLPTIFRLGSQVHPVSFRDLAVMTTGNCGFAQLSDANEVPRYRATCINAETALAKQTIVQSENSLAPINAGTESKVGGVFVEQLDKRPAQLLEQQRFGVAEPESSGVTFSAPIEDLVTPQPLKEGEKQPRSYPCYFLEDLWVGYRLDLRDLAQGCPKGFRSVHVQSQCIELTDSKRKIEGDTEDYFEREQPDDKKLECSSTELALFIGFSTGQVQDYREFLGLKSTRPSTTPPPFTVRIGSYSDGTPLLVGHVYEYRLRLVLLGGTSLPRTVPSDEHAKAAMYRQRFLFPRYKTLRAGEVLGVPGAADGREDSSREGDPTRNNDRGDKTIYLTKVHSKHEIVLVPAPISVDESRFYGLVCRDVGERKRYQGRKHITDIGKFFKDHPVRDLSYFYDPFVHGVVVRPTYLNGDPRSPEVFFEATNGSYRELVKHVVMDPIELSYGDPDDWEGFRALTLSFRVGCDGLPVARRSDWGMACREVEFEIPPAGYLRLSIVPMFKPSHVTESASYIASGREFSEWQANMRQRSSEGFVVVPAISEQVINVVHGVVEPRRIPVLMCDDAGDNPMRRRSKKRVAPGCGVSRMLDENKATLQARVELDAASTSELRVEASWEDIDDNPKQSKYLLNPANSTVNAHNVVFEPCTPEPPSPQAFHALLTGKMRGRRQGDRRSPSIVDRFTLQCAENRVFLGVAGKEGPNTPVQIDFKDQRRKIARVRAVGVSRFKQLFSDAAEKDLQRVSEDLVMDVPSTLRLDPPAVSHVIPIVRTVWMETNGTTQKQNKYGMRIFAARGWFQSNAGERLAIGCAPLNVDPAGLVAIPKYVTQWGEDPIQRPGLASSTRIPRASDFVSPDKVGITDCPELDPVLYPPDRHGGAELIRYHDDIPLGDGSVSAPPQRHVSLASCALTADPSSGLWYCDVWLEAEFSGWIGLALYRHQPHALEGRQLSAGAAWVYAALLYGEPVAWTERAGNLHVTVGPVYDPNVSFEFDSLRYKDGVSANLSETSRGDSRTLVAMSKYFIGNAAYFEGIVSCDGFKWNLLKRRFDAEVSSIAPSTRRRRHG